MSLQIRQPAAFDELDQELLEKGFAFEREISKRHFYWKRVYRRDKTEFVMKVIDKRLFYTNPDLKESALLEYKIALRIGAAWPNLCCFVDFFYSKGFVVFIYEFYYAGNLEERLLRGEPFEYNEIVLILKNILMGIEQLKMAGVVHKNLDAGLVYFTRSSLKIGGSYEFCGFEEQTKMSNRMHSFFISTVNTVSSLTPEVIFNQICSSKTSLFGIGLILYRIYHEGAYPYQIHDIHDLFLIYKDNALPKLRDKTTPKPLVYIITELLQVNYSNRFSFSELKTIANQLFRDLPLSQRTTEAIDDFFQGRKSKTIINLPPPKPKSPTKLPKTLFNKQISLPKFEAANSILRLQGASSTFLEPIISPFSKEKKKPMPKNPNKNSRKSLGINPRASSHPPTERTPILSLHRRTGTDSFALKTQSVDLRHIAPRVLRSLEKRDSVSSLNTLPGLNISGIQVEKRFSRDSLNKINIGNQKLAPFFLK